MIPYCVILGIIYILYFKGYSIIKKNKLSNIPFVFSVLLLIFQTMSVFTTIKYGLYKNGITPPVGVTGSGLLMGKIAGYIGFFFFSIIGLLIIYIQILLNNKKQTNNYKKNK